MRVSNSAVSGCVCVYECVSGAVSSMCVCVCVYMRVCVVCVCLRTCVCVCVCVGVGYCVHGRYVCVYTCTVVDHCSGHSLSPSVLNINNFP